MGVLKSDSHFFNNPSCKNFSTTGQIPSLSSLFRGYSLIHTGCHPSLSLTLMGRAFFALWGTSVAHTLGYTWSVISSLILFSVETLARDKLIICIYCWSFTSGVIFPFLNLITASNCSNKSLPKSAFGELGIYRNLWMPHCFPSLNLRGSQKYHPFTLASCTFYHNIIISQGHQIFVQNLIHCPVLTKNSTFFCFFPSFITISGSARVDSPRHISLLLQGLLSSFSGYSVLSPYPWIFLDIHFSGGQTFCITHIGPCLVGVVPIFFCPPPW